MQHSPIAERQLFSLYAYRNVWVLILRKPPSLLWSFMLLRSSMLILDRRSMKVLVGTRRALEKTFGTEGTCWYQTHSWENFWYK